MLEDILLQTEERAKEYLPKKKNSKITGVQVYGTGITFESQPSEPVN